MKLIDYAESQGKTNFEWHSRVNEPTRQEANITLGFLLTGGAASIAWAISNLAGADPSRPLDAAVIALAVWLFGIAMGVVFLCLNFAPSMPPANHPSNVYLPEFNTESIRRVQLDYLENAIILSIAKGQRRAKFLYRLRLLTCLSPAVFLVAWRLSLLWLR